MWPNRVFRRGLSLLGTPSASRSLNSFRQQARCSWNFSQGIWTRTCIALSAVTSRSQPRSVSLSFPLDHALISNSCWSYPGTTVSRRHFYGMDTADQVLSSLHRQVRSWMRGLPLTLNRIWKGWKNRRGSSCETLDSCHPRSTFPS
jgi:hypothetical protein